MSSSLLLQLGVSANSQSLLQTKPVNDVLSYGSDPEIDMSVGPEDSRSCRSQMQSYPICFGLPYQDHNYVAPPPPTPPASPPPAPKVNGHIDIEDVSCNTVVVTTPVATTPPQDTNSVDDSVTRCICDFQHDDGYMICCDKCGVWQHVDCMGVDRGNIPDVYKCEECEPRKVDKPRAIQIQTNKRELLRNILPDSSATETEDETPHGKSKKEAKGKKKEKKENSKLSNKQKKFKRLKNEKEKEVRRKQNNGQNKRKLLNIRAERERVSKPKRTRKLTESSALAPPPCTEGNSSWETSADSYILADSNNVCGDLQKILATRRFNGQHSRPDGALPNPELLAQLYRVAPVAPDKKGLEAVVPIAQKMAVAEFKGNVLLRDQYDRDGEFFKRTHPSVLFYSRLEGLDICVDASRYGSDTRFVRRSCTPNCEIQAIIHNGDIQFYIFSTNDIEEGDEITIPFDFNYQDCSYSVECACSRPNCPVSKFHQMDKSIETKQPLPSPPPLQPKSVRKKRRSTKSVEEKTEEVSSNSRKRSQSISSSPDPPPPPPSMSKRRRLAPLSPIRVNTTIKTETVKPALASPDEEDHNSPGQSGYLPPEPTTPNPSIVMTAEEKEAEAERRKKMTREERKMEAIMKAFEKLEKREERRKEAIARMGTTRKSQDSVDVPVRKEKPEVELEVHVPAIPKEPVVLDSRPRLAPRKGKKKSRPGTPARRQSRANSSISAADSSADETSSIPSSVQGLTTPGPLTSDPPSAVSTATPCSTASDKMFRFPKTKKHLMNEWLNEKSQDLKPLSIKTEPLEVVEDETEFVKCVPSPHTNSLSHMRRNSLSAAIGPRGPSSGGSQPDHNMGSAKKRWLRQAMFETSHPPSGSTSPVPQGSMSPNPNGSSSNSPRAASPVDFVTPLKKRRLARESIGLENPYTLNPSTPTPSTGEGSEVLSSAGTTPGSEEKPKVIDNKLRNGFRPHLSPASSKGAIVEQFSIPDAEKMLASSSIPVKTEVAESLPIASFSDIASPSEYACINSLGSSSDELSESKPVLDCEEPQPTSSQCLISNSVKDEPQPSFVKLNVVDVPGSCVRSKHEALDTLQEDSDDNVDTTDSHAEDKVEAESPLNVSLSSSSADSLFNQQTIDSNRPDTAVVVEDRTLPQPSGSTQGEQPQTVHNSEASSSPGEGEDSDMAVSQTVDFVEARPYPLPSAATMSRDHVDSSELLPTGGNVCDSTDTCSVSRQTDISSLVSCSSALSEVDKDVVTSEPRQDSTNQSEFTDRTCCSTTSSALGEPRFGTTASSSTDQPEAGGSELPTSENINMAIPSVSREADSANNNGWEEPGSVEGMVGPSSSSMPSKGDTSVEEGELDSSFSDMESQMKKVTVSPVVDQTVSCSSDTRVVVSAALPAQEEEKEEGEITDDEPDEEPEASTLTAQPSISCSSERNGSGGSSEISSTNYRWSKYHHRGCDTAKADQPHEEDSTHAGPSTSAHHPLGTGRPSSNRSISSTANNKNTHCEQMNSPGQDYSCVDSSSAPCDKELSSSGENSVYSLNMENSVSSTASDCNEENYSNRNVAESSYSSTDTSPTAKSTSPSSSSILISAGASSSTLSKKKVSLLEYRKRLKDKGISGSAKRMASSSGKMPPTSREATPTTLAPLPLFGQSASPGPGREAEKKGVCESPGTLSEKEEQDVRWSVSATAAERMREQTPLSLTERLRKEFGLDASEEEDVRSGHSGIPPPPLLSASTPPVPPGRPADDDDEYDDDDDDDDEPPPPPPPGQPNYQQPAGLVAPPHLGQVQMGQRPALLPTPIMGHPPRGVTPPPRMVPPPPPPMGQPSMVAARPLAGQIQGPRMIPPPSQQHGRIISPTPIRGPPAPQRPPQQQPQLQGQLQGQCMPAPRQRGPIPSLLSLSFPPNYNGPIADSPGNAAGHHHPPPAANSSQGQVAPGYGQTSVFENYEGNIRQQGFSQPGLPVASSGQQSFSQASQSGYVGQGLAASASPQAYGQQGLAATTSFSHGAAPAYHHCAPSSSQAAPPTTTQQYESYSTRASNGHNYNNSYPSNSYQ